MNADAAFDAIAELARLVVQQRAEQRQALRDARNARRRARYARSPRLPRTPAPPVEEVDELVEEPGCRCPFISMPPCWWCENGGNNEPEED